jgi:hypothetical protein
MADIFGVRVAPDLSILDSLIIICNDPGGQTDPAVVFNGTDYIVVWADAFAESRDIPLRAVRVDTHGVVIGTGVHFGSGNNMTDIAYDNNRCLVVWSVGFDGIHGRFLNDQAMPEDTVFRIDGIIGSDALVSIDFDGSNYLVVWSDFDSTGVDRDIFGRLVSPDGNIVSNRIPVACADGHQANPSLAFNGENYLVAWLEASGTINGRFVAPTGMLINEIFQISDSSSYARDGVNIAAGQSNHLVVWAEWHADFDIYGNCEVMVDVREGNAPAPLISPVTTIVSGPLSSCAYDILEIFDVTGRRIPLTRVNQGVYFLEDRNQTVHKIIKID